MTFNGPKRRTLVLAAVLSLAALSGCATRVANPDDPLEGYNRAMFRFNETVDRAVVRPVAQAYHDVAPRPVRSSIGNFFGNVGDVWIGSNNLLQGKIRDGLSDFLRFAVNTTIGMFGIFDVASGLELPKHDEDFGQTLGSWGVGEGAYFVVPFFGPRTLRDAAVLPIDMAGDDVWGVRNIPLRNSLTALRIVNTRANLLGIDKTLEEGTLDKYAYARDFYLQQRRYKVYDGNPPLEDFDDMNGAALPPGVATDVAADMALQALQLVDASGERGRLARSTGQVMNK